MAAQTQHPPHQPASRRGQRRMVCRHFVARYRAGHRHPRLVWQVPAAPIRRVYFRRAASQQARAQRAHFAELGVERLPQQQPLRPRVRSRRRANHQPAHRQNQQRRFKPIFAHHAKKPRCGATSAQCCVCRDGKHERAFARVRQPRAQPIRQPENPLAARLGVPQIRVRGRRHQRHAPPLLYPLAAQQRQPIARQKQTLPHQPVHALQKSGLPHCLHHRRQRRLARF